MIYIKLRPGYTFDFDDPKGAVSFEYSLTTQTWLISIGQAENLRCFKTHVQGACYAH